MSSEPSNLYKLEEFVELLMPTLEAIDRVPQVPYETNNWIWQNVLLYGSPGSGKSEGARLFAELAAKRYNPDVMAATNLERYIVEFLSAPFIEPKKIQLMFFDDLAGKKLSSTNQNEWILLRHTIQNITHLNNGLILTFLATQRYYALDKSLRESITSLIAFSTPSNPFDASIIKRFIGEEAYAFLEFQKFLLMTRQTRKHYSAFYLNGIKGILDMPMAEIDFLRKWKFTRKIYGFQR